MMCLLKLLPKPLKQKLLMDTQQKGYASGSET